MKLNDVRRFAVRSRLELEFETADGASCVIGKDGVVRMPDLRAATNVRVTEEFDRAGSFKIRQQEGERRIARAELEAMCGGHADETADHHDE
jgi:hypothetical protein